MKREQKKSKKKKKKQPQLQPQQSSNALASEPLGDASPPAKEDTECWAVHALVEAFGTVSVEEAIAAYREAGGNPNRAAEIFGANLLDNGDDPSTSSTSSAFSASESGFGSSSVSGSASGSSEGCPEFNCVGNPMSSKRGRGNKGKKFVAATGTVSTVLGKDYLKASTRRDTAKADGFSTGMDFNGGKDEDVEQFIFNMLGDESELSLAVVRDVLGHCGYNIEKALALLLDLTASSCEQLRNYDCPSTNAEVDCIESFADRLLDSSSHSYETVLHDSPWFIDSDYRNHSIPSDSGNGLMTTGRSVEPNTSQEVLECLYKIPRSPRHEPRSMNWRSVAKKMHTSGHGLEVCRSSSESPQNTFAKGDEYAVLRKEAEQHWDSMRSTYQKAAAAYSKGERGYAAYLSEEGKKYSRMGQQADERASQEIFRARNRSIENVITIDLHGQHVKQAMRLLKFHLLLPSIQRLKVITGCGSHGVGKSKLKQSVIRLVEKEGIEWSEENRGMVVIKLDQHRNFNFVDSDSDTD